MATSGSGFRIQITLLLANEGDRSSTSAGSESQTNVELPQQQMELLLTLRSELPGGEARTRQVAISYRFE